MSSEMKFSLILTAVGLVGSAGSWGWLLWDARNPSGGVPIGIGFLCMVTGGVAVAGLLCVLATYLSRFIVGEDE